MSGAFSVGENILYWKGELIMGFQTPAEIAASVCAAGKAKTELPFLKMFLLGILAGVYIGFGANLATKIGSMDTLLPGGTPGGQFLFGAVFSVGLMLVVIAGAELFTGNNMACFASACNGQASWGGLLYNWVVVYFANFVGSVSSGLHRLLLEITGDKWMLLEPLPASLRWVPKPWRLLKAKWR